jgi:hypothetical protein
MTSLAAPIIGTTGQAGRHRAGRMVIVVAAAASFGVSVLYAHAHPGPVTDPALARLLRAMAAIKLLLAACAGAAVLWRLAAPVRPAWLAAYAAAAGAMAAGPALIWSLAHIGLGALLLHGGLLASILLLWRDPATGLRLERAIAARKARLRG